MTKEMPAGFHGIADFGFWEQMSAVERRPYGVLLQAAHRYLGTLKWFGDCTGFWLGLAEPDLVGVFLYRRKPVDNIPEFHWIIAGPRWPFPVWSADGSDEKESRNQHYSGLPAAYIWTGHPDFADPDSAQTPAAALESYTNVIQDWVDAVKVGGDLSKVFPVDIPEGKAPREYAFDVEKLLDRIREDLLPKYAENLR
ncbi:hypothetical protein [Oricola cellulosilytica]|uniref:Uncharacterized protein n=1 Tax=Oricola cellulosilytica TaxID=1429082 RepID=A0A4R0PFN2_9HYPH|nr:hypothetical protein [Oricola cellulosilytica]TCD16655.1 hypothetical protein E0D97_04380 [Oricola cellulosilytica]